MFGNKRRAYNEAVALARQKEAEKKAYAQFCRDRAPYLIQIAQAILRSARVTEPEFFENGYPMTEGFYLSQLDGEVLLRYHKVHTPEEVEVVRQMTLQLATHLRAAAASVGCLWPIRDFTPNGPTVVLGLPTDEQITMLYRHFVEQ